MKRLRHLALGLILILPLKSRKTWSWKISTDSSAW